MNSCSHPDLGTDGCGICSQGRRLAVMQETLVELTSLTISPAVDYSTEGLNALQEEMVKARSYAERASSIYSILLGQRQWVRWYRDRVVERWQEQYDSVVEDTVRRYSDLSWEERASIFRLKCLDLEVAKREAEANLKWADTYVEQGDVLSRSLFRARNDLMSIAEVMRMGNTLRELD
jgi:hypothetical protein